MVYSGFHLLYNITHSPTDIVGNTIRYNNTLITVFIIGLSGVIDFKIEVKIRIGEHYILLLPFVSQHNKGLYDYE